MRSKVVTIDRHIIDQERNYPDASGRFSALLYDLALAAKIISREVNMAGLIDILGQTGDTNVQGERVQKLDVFAQEVIVKAMDHAGHLCCMVSEEHGEIIPIPDRFDIGNYVLLFDPLDGSSNINVNVSIGTIFSIHHRVTPKGGAGTLVDCLQPGYRQLAAGYVVYGSSTMLVYTTGAARGVHGFTLDPSIGEFLLSHRDIRIPDPPAKVYSVNEAYYARWSRGQQRLVDHFRGVNGEGEGGFKSRYIGSLVSDFHRTLLQGGIFMYPPDSKSPGGKLRVLYEAAPLAMICEAAGGRASDGGRNILDIVPEGLHDRTPLFLGSASLVDLAEEYLRDGSGS
ncbi:MAG: class 1 fructose-bisphosphatase [Gemmatimonadota bacterium]|nr:class 1 fructose-bisphosphatase [Gemmatimonadota bacterium]